MRRKCIRSRVGTRWQHVDSFVEDPEIELEAALILYEKGVQLSSSIQKTLESAEQRVAQVAADGSLLEEDNSAAEG